MLYICLMQRDDPETPLKNIEKVFWNTDTDTYKNTFVPERCYVGRAYC